MKSPKQILKDMTDILLKAQEVEVEAPAIEVETELAEEAKPEVKEEVKEEVAVQPTGDFATKQELQAFESKISKAVAELTALVSQMKDLKGEADVPAKLSEVKPEVEAETPEVKAEEIEVKPEVEAEAEPEVIHSPEVEVLSKKANFKISKKRNTQDAVFEMLFAE